MSDAENLPSVIKEEDREAVVEANTLRGAILGSFAHVEFLLADFCVRAWALPEYRPLRGPFPYKVETRLTKFRELFKNGPLLQFRDEAEELAGTLLSHEEVRHFMAHGLMTVEAHSNNFYVVEFRLYKPTKAGADIGVITWPLDGMRAEADEVTAYSGEWIRFFYKLHSEFDWVG